jgi:hypothetical protein
MPYGCTSEIRLRTPCPTRAINVTDLLVMRMLFSSISEIRLLTFHPTSAEGVTARSEAKMLCSDISDIRLRTPNKLLRAAETLHSINSSCPSLSSITILLHSRRTKCNASVDTMDGDEIILKARMPGIGIKQLLFKNSTHGMKAITAVFSRGKVCAQSSK